MLRADLAAKLGISLDELAVEIRSDIELSDALGASRATLASKCYHVLRKSLKGECLEPGQLDAARMLLSIIEKDN